MSKGTFPSPAVLVKSVSDQVTQYGTIAKMPADQVGNVRNDMYLASEAIRFLMKDKESELRRAGSGPRWTPKRVDDGGWVPVR